MISNISKEKKNRGIYNFCWQNSNCYSQCVRKKPTLVSDNNNECWWVTSWKESHEKSGSWLIRILIHLFIKSDYVRIMLLEVDGGVSHGWLMERSHSTRVGTCVPSLMFAHILSQGDGPCLNLTLTSPFHTGTSSKTGTGPLRWHPGVTPRGDTLDSGSKAQELSLRARWARPMHNAEDTGILPFSSQNYLFI